MKTIPSRQVVWGPRLGSSMAQGVSHSIEVTGQNEKGIILRFCRKSTQPRRRSSHCKCSEGSSIGDPARPHKIPQDPQDSLCMTRAGAPMGGRVSRVSGPCGAETMAGHVLESSIVTCKV